MIVIVAARNHPSAEIRLTRDEWTKGFCATLIRANEPAICPRAHCDAVREYLPTQIEPTLADEHVRLLTRELVRFARQVIVVQFDGWTHDPDVVDALRLAEQLRIPVRSVDPNLGVRELLAA